MQGEQALVAEPRPAGGPDAGPQVFELRAGRGARRVAGRRAGHRVGQRLVLRVQTDAHGDQLSSLSTRAAFWYRNFGHTSSLNGTLGMSRKIRSSDRPIGK